MKQKIKPYLLGQMRIWRRKKKPFILTFTLRLNLRHGKVILKNIDRGTYFRIVADVFVNDKSLAQKLIEKGLAVPYDGGTKKHNWCED